MEFAQGLAARVLREGPADDAGRIDLAFQICMSRKPSVDEANVLRGVLERERAAFAVSTDAKALAGDKLPASADAKDFAPWVMVSRVVLNLDEAITRE